MIVYVYCDEDGHPIAEGTVDEQVMRALQAKDTSQAALLAALKERRKE